MAESKEYFINHKLFDYKMEKRLKKSLDQLKENAPQIWSNKFKLEEICDSETDKNLETKKQIEVAISECKKAHVFPTEIKELQSLLK